MIIACTQPDLQSLAESDLIVRGFETGATDCMLDPFSATELASKRCSALRRKMKQVQQEPSELIALGYLTIYCAERDEAGGADRGLRNRTQCGGQT